MMRRSHALSLGLLAGTALATPATAQVALIPPAREALDQNGVNLATGSVLAMGPKLSIGTGNSSLTYQPQARWGAVNGVQWLNSFRYALYGTAGSSVQMVTGLSSTTFNYDSASSSYVNQQGTGETLSVSGTTWTFTMRDGTVVLLDKSMFGTGTSDLRFEGSGTVAAATTLTFPNKERWTFSYRSIEHEKQFGFFFRARLQSVQSSNGLMAKFQYADNGTTDTPGWINLTKATLLNSAVDYCNPAADTCTFSTAWPSLTFVSTSTSSTVTDSLARTTTYTFSGAGLTAIRRPSSAANNTTITYDPVAKAQTITTDGRTWNYSWSLTSPLMTATVTNPDSTPKVYVTNTTINQVTSFKDELNRTTAYQYDTQGRLTDVTYPEANKLHYTYDARGNVTEARAISKTPGTPSDIVQTADYPVSCTNAVTCNQPISTTDPRGNVTDYTYDSTHGGVLTVTSPAPTVGAVRPQTRYGYTALQAYYKNSSGSIVASGQPTYLLTSISECQTLSSCAGAADEVKTTVGYGPQTTGTPNNLFAVSVSKGAGNGTLTATQALTYDNIGNTTYVDGPLPGTLDTTRTLYDAVRQISGQVGPDPDGAGTLPNRAIRLTYNLDGQVTKLEQGTTAGQTDPAWSAFTPAAFVDTTYDASGRKTTETLKNGATSFALTRYSYDSVGRLDCAAQRVNPAAYGSLPASACTLGTQGSFGPDRITQQVYDAASELTQNKVGVGTTDAATERTLTYTSNGSVQTLKDAENNLTTYVYDGFDRLSQTQYPNITKGSETSNPVDSEQLGYDPSGNVTSQRLRDGNSISFTYDNRNRVTLKNLPGTEPDVTYAYDNLDRLTAASQTGNNLSFSYDALSRRLSESGPQGTTTFGYDLANRRTQITYPAGGSALTIDYTYLTTDDLSAIKQAATNLASYAYDNLGNRASVTFANGVVQNFTWDPVSRLATLSNDLSGSTSDLSATLAYNPASQITSNVRTGDAYAWTGHSNQNNNGTANGLNQLTTYGAKSLTHDGRGNVIAYGTKSFGYSSENLLTSGPNGTILAYDPATRLLSDRLRHNDESVRLR